MLGMRGPGRTHLSDPAAFIRNLRTALAAWRTRAPAAISKVTVEARHCPLACVLVGVDFAPDRQLVGLTVAQEHLIAEDDGDLIKRRGGTTSYEQTPRSAADSGEVAPHSKMMSPRRSEMMSPLVPR